MVTVGFDLMVKFLTIVSLHPWLSITICLTVLSPTDEYFIDIGDPVAPESVDESIFDPLPKYHL
jgi:hypothetical protein